MDSCRHKSTTHQYERHRPEEDLLYQVVSRNFQAFFKKCEESGHQVPKFIKREFESFLRCGVLSYGFARVYCQSCKYDRLIGFSCKKRGFCGSCLARRISEISGALNRRSDTRDTNSAMGLECTSTAAVFDGLRQQSVECGNVGIHRLSVRIFAKQSKKMWWHSLRRGKVFSRIGKFHSEVRQCLKFKCSYPFASERWCLRTIT